MNQRVLTLHLKHEYWEAICDGTKTEEYRIVKPYWEKRLVDREYNAIHLFCGYPKAGDDSRRLVRKWNGYRYTMIQHPEFGNEPVTVFAIDVSEEVQEGA